MKKRAWKKWGLIALGLVLLALLCVKLLLGRFAPFFWQAGEILDDKRYLILFQNNSEIRPTGGFISAYGILSFEDGFNLEFKDSYQVGEKSRLGAAPKAFSDLLDDPKFKGWYFRDSNYDVDFTEAVEDVQKLYAAQSGDEAEFDGVFAVNFEFLEDLMGLYELEVDGVKLTERNLFAVLEHEVKNIDTHNTQAIAERKDILKDLAKLIIREMALSPLQYDELRDTLAKALDQKKILLYFADEDLEDLVLAENWGGKLDFEQYENFIHVNFSNIGGRKADRYVDKRHSYFISFNEGPRAKVRYTLELNHYGSYNLNSDWYKAYVRMFIPEGSEVLSVEGDFYKDYSRVRGNELEFYLEMLPSEQREVVVEYYLPKGMKAEDFELDLIKQPGLSDQWEVIVQYPGDRSLDGREIEVQENVGVWRGELTEDIKIEPIFIEDELPPLVVWQRFTDLNEIEVNFSEPLDLETAFNLANYKIVDMNYIDESTDQIRVVNASFSGNTLTLQTRGIERAEEERYRLILKGLTDQYGNATKPENLELTVVQRL